MWSHASLWWILAGILVALELMTGTFYLLMLSIGLAAGAVAAHLGADVTGQMVIAALVGAVSTFSCYWVRRRRPGDPSARAKRSVNLDIGEIVQVDAWQADGTATVQYRGAPWTVIHRPGVQPAPGPHRVAELVGIRLLVDPV